jgi:histidine ammonia-lyase
MEQHALHEKDALALINGSPCAAALAADAAIGARRRLAVIEDVFALAWEALAAPMDHLDPALEALWEDPAEIDSLAALRARLEGGAAERRPYQAPVSFRILPRMLGRYRRAVDAVEAAAGVSLRAVTDNPVYLPPDAGHPDGRVLSNGGFHNASAWPAMDELAAACADLCTLAERQGAKILHGPTSHLPDQLRAGPLDPRYLGCLPMVQVGFGEAARRAAQRTFLPGSESGGFGQNDVAAPHFFAWRAQAEGGRLLEAALAPLAIIASQALHVTGRAAPPALAARLAGVREAVPVLVDEMRAPGPEAEALAEHFRAEILPEAHP